MVVQIKHVNRVGPAGMRRSRLRGRLERKVVVTIDGHGTLPARALWRSKCAQIYRANVTWRPFGTHLPSFTSTR